MARADHISEGRSPKIYAYTTTNMSLKPWGTGTGVGLIKVGYTDKPNAHDRIAAQLISLPSGEEHYKLLHVESAFNESGEVFLDTAVHAILRNEFGCTQLRSESGRPTEWFECTLGDVQAAIASARSMKAASRTIKHSFGMRPEQLSAVEVTSNYFLAHPRSPADGAPHFLWNAKMRFGKTFTTYQLAKKMGWKRILVLTYKPAVQSSWREDLQSHSDFNDWLFVGGGEEITSFTTSNQPLVWFASFQDVNQRNRDGSIKNRLLPMHKIEWDCVVIDEYHFGAWRAGAKEIYDVDRSERMLDLLGEEFDEKSTPLRANHFLYLSGTPFRAIATGEFLEDQIYNWTYSDEQAAKNDWQTSNPGNEERNPWRELPKLVMLTYKMPDELRSVAQDGEFNEFDLNTFFQASRLPSGEARFDREPDVRRWLQLLQGRWLGSHTGKPGSSSYVELPFADARLKSALRHTLWFLPNVAACDAMAVLLRSDPMFSGYEVVVAAGAKAGIGMDALPPVERAQGPTPSETLSITLTCSKLTTGVTVKPWTGVFMLRDTTSPEAYFQTAFRAQSPWTVKVVDGEHGVRTDVLKDTCYVLDFAPTRAFEKINDYATRLAAGGNCTPEERVQELLGYLPVLAYDGSTMEEVDSNTLLDVVATGIGATMLARKWTSAMLVNVNSATLSKLLTDTELVEALQQMESFSNLNLKVGAERSLNTEKDLQACKREFKPASSEQLAEEKESNTFRAQLRANLIKFASRLPVFMYLTEHREIGLKDVIQTIDTDLFTRVTGLTKENFQAMCDLGLFNPQLMNEAVLAFRRFEESSLTYLNPSEPLRYTSAGWETSPRRADDENLSGKHY